MKRKLLLALLVVAMLFTASCQSKTKLPDTTTAATSSTAEPPLPDDLNLNGGIYSLELLDRITELHMDDKHMCRYYSCGPSGLHLSEKTLRELVASLGLQFLEENVQSNFRYYTCYLSADDWFISTSINEEISDGWKDLANVEFEIVALPPPAEFWPQVMSFKQFRRLSEYQNDFTDILLQEETIHTHGVITSANPPSYLQTQIGYNAKYQISRDRGVEKIFIQTKYAYISITFAYYYDKNDEPANMYPDNEIFRNLLDSSSAEIQINDLIEEWEAILEQDASKFGSKWTKDDYPEDYGQHACS